MRSRDVLSEWKTVTHDWVCLCVCPCTQDRVHPQTHAPSTDVLRLVLGQGALQAHGHLATREVCKAKLWAPGQGVRYP